MSAFQLTTVIGVPMAVLFVTVALLAFARPDRDTVNGPYAAYLALASVFSLYLGLLSLAALGEAISQQLVGNDTSRELLGPTTLRTYFSLVSEGGASSVAAFAALTALMGAGFAYHARLRSDLAASETTNATVTRVERAYRAGACFAMLSLIAIGALVAGSAGYDFFAEQIGSTDRLRDLAMGSFVSYGALVLLGGAVFRLNISTIRGRFDNDHFGDPPIAELDERGTLA